MVSRPRAHLHPGPQAGGQVSGGVRWQGFLGSGGEDPRVRGMWQMGRLQESIHCLGEDLARHHTAITSC